MIHSLVGQMYQVLKISFLCLQSHVYVRTVPGGHEYAVDQNAEGQQEKLEKSLQGRHCKT